MYIQCNTKILKCKKIIKAHHKSAKLKCLNKSRLDTYCAAFKAEIYIVQASRNKMVAFSLNCGHSTSCSSRQYGPARCQNYSLHRGTSLRGPTWAPGAPCQSPPGSWGSGTDPLWRCWRPVCTSGSLPCDTDKETPSHFHGKHKFLVVDLKVELGLHNLIRQSLVIFCKTYFYIMQITGHMQSCTRIFIMLTICYVSFKSSQSKNAECHLSQFIHDSDSECLLG